MRNLKPYFDAVQTAEARVRDLAAQIDDLFTSGKTDEAVALRPQLDEAKAKAKDANDLYLSMRNTDDGDGVPGDGRRIMQVDEKDLAIGMTPNEIKNYSLLRMIRAAADARSNPHAWDEAGLELEASRAMAKKLGREPQGFFMPWDIMISPVNRQGGGMRLRNTQQAGDPEYGGYLVRTDLLINSFIDVLRNKMITQQAGARVLTGLVGNIDIPKKGQSSTAYWIGEGTTPNKSDLKFGQIEARPRTVAAYLQLTRRFLKQASMDAEMMARDDLATTLAVAIDQSGLHGLGAANQPRGVQYTTGIGSVVGGENGAAPDWADIVNLETEVAVDNADTGSLAYITNAKVRGKLKQTPKVSGTDARMVWDENNSSTPLNGYPAYVTNQVSSTLSKGTSVNTCSAIFYGNWEDLVYCLWGGLDVIVDPYTNSTSGDVLITSMQDVDVVERRAQSFAAMLDALTN